MEVEDVVKVDQGRVQAVPVEDSKVTEEALVDVGKGKDVVDKMDMAPYVKLQVDKTSMLLIDPLLFRRCNICALHAFDIAVSFPSGPYPASHFLEFTHVMHFGFSLALSPGHSQFFNVTRRKLKNWEMRLGSVGFQICPITCGGNYLIFYVTDKCAFSVNIL